LSLVEQRLQELKGGDCSNSDDAQTTTPDSFTPRSLTPADKALVGEQVPQGTSSGFVVVAESPGTYPDRPVLTILGCVYGNNSIEIDLKPPEKTKYSGLRVAGYVKGTDMPTVSIEMPNGDKAQYVVSAERRAPFVARLQF
jgi:hypothetical protein